MEILQYFESLRTPFLTNLFRIFTALGEQMVIIAIICAIYWCYNKKLAYRITFGLFASGLLVQTLKITFRIPRPWVRFPNLNPVQEVIGTATGYSFPSGHTNATTALYSMLFLSTKKVALRIGCVVMILGVGISRMYLGVHTMQDVLVSFLVTLATVILVYQISKITFTNKVRVVIASAIVLASVAVLIYAYVLLNQGIIETKYASDVCEAAFAGIGLGIGWYIESRFIQFNEKTKDVRLQIVKFVFGISVAAGLKLICKLILPSGIIADGMANFILVSWVMIGYPLIIKKMFQIKELDNERL